MMPHGARGTGNRSLAVQRFMAPLLMLGLLCAGGVSLQSGPALPAETKQFDFWIGEWKCSGESYGPNGQQTHTDAENSVTREFDGNVVHEHFTMGAFHGMSVSVFVPAKRAWCQTWVDSQGAYIPLSGQFKDGKMTLETLRNPRTPTKFNRMVYENISADAFDWNWESTVDGGKTWRVNWHLHYARKKPG